MKKGGGSDSTIIIGPSKSVLVYVLHSLEYVLGIARFRVFVQKCRYFKENDKRYTSVLQRNFIVDNFNCYPDYCRFNSQ